MFLAAELVEVSAQFLFDFFTTSISLLVLYTFSLYSQFRVDFSTSSAHVAVSLSTVLLVTMSTSSYILHAGRFSFPFLSLSSSKDSRISRNRKTRADIPGLIRMPRVKTVLWLQIFGQKALSRLPWCTCASPILAATCLTRTLSLFLSLSLKVDLDCRPGLCHTRAKVNFSSKDFSRSLLRLSDNPLLPSQSSGNSVSYLDSAPFRFFLRFLFFFSLSLSLVISV